MYPRCIQHIFQLKSDHGSVLTKLHVHTEGFYKILMGVPDQLRNHLGMPSRHCTPTTQSQESTRLNHFWVQLACLQFGFKVWEFVFPSFQVSNLHTLAMCSCGYVDMSLSLWLQEAWGQPNFESSNHQRHALKARSPQGSRTVQARDLQVPQNYIRTLLVLEISGRI